MKNNTNKLAKASMISALICMVTLFIKIPSPFKGYINLGDAFVLVAGWQLSPLYAFFAAGIGSALADIFAGYAVYAPITFIIKAVMAIVASCINQKLSKKIGHFSARLSGAIMAELIMAFGYFAFESVLYGYEISALNMPINIVQGVAGIIAGMIFIKIWDRFTVY